MSTTDSKTAQQLKQTQHNPELHDKESWGEWAREKVEVLKEKAHDLVEGTRETVHHLTEKKDEDLPPTSSKEGDLVGTERQAPTAKAGSVGASAHELKGDKKFISKDIEGSSEKKDISGNKDKIPQEFHNPNQSVKNVFQTTKNEGTKPSDVPKGGSHEMGSKFGMPKEIKVDNPNLDKGKILQEQQIKS